MTFKVCPRCEIEYCDWVALCPRCGAPLVEPGKIATIDPSQPSVESGPFPRSRPEQSSRRG